MARSLLCCLSIYLRRSVCKWGGYILEVNAIRTIINELVLLSQLYTDNEIRIDWVRCVANEIYFNVLMNRLNYLFRCDRSGCLQIDLLIIRTISGYVPF